MSRGAKKRAAAKAKKQANCRCTIFPEHYMVRKMGDTLTSFYEECRFCGRKTDQRKMSLGDFG